MSALLCVRVCGRMSVCKAPPRRALVIATGPQRRLRDLMSATGRKAYNANIWHMPGVPEAVTMQDANKAVATFIGWLRDGKRNGISFPDIAPSWPEKGGAA